jgi:hypothetical protein
MCKEKKTNKCAYHTDEVDARVFVLMNNVERRTRPLIFCLLLSSIAAPKHKKKNEFTCSHEQARAEK